MKNEDGKIFNTISRVVLISLIFIAAMAAMTLPTVKASTPGVIYVDPPYQEIPVGTYFTVKVNLTVYMSHINNVTFILTFDPNLMECIGVTNTSFPPPPMNFSKTIDNINGIIKVNISTIQYIINNGTIADITFHCKGAGPSFLNFTIASLNIFPINPTFVYNGTCNQVPPPVGGEVLMTDALALLIPWIAAAGAVAAATVLVIASRRTFNR